MLPRFLRASILWKTFRIQESPLRSLLLCRSFNWELKWKPVYQIGRHDHPQGCSWNQTHSSSTCLPEHMKLGLRENSSVWACSYPCALGPPMLAPSELFFLTRGSNKISFVSEKDFKLCLATVHGIAVSSQVDLLLIRPCGTRHTSQVIAAVRSIHLQWGSLRQQCLEVRHAFENCFWMFFGRLKLG